MRLTLRTLLAYMDDILDPNDHEELGHKIEASPFATELIHRSRDAVRRLRLSAPEPTAGESGDLHGGDAHLDANEMSEYLDNTMSPAAVADFERSCLEAGPHADMLLAEAASCHHILTMVLGEPAEVDADMRQRMYDLLNLPQSESSSPAEQPTTAHVAGQHVRMEPAHVAPTLAPVPTHPEPAPAQHAAPAKVTPTTANVRDERSRVPDYLIAAARAKQRSRLFTAAVIAAVLGGIGAFFVLTTPEAKLPPQVASGKMGDPEDILAPPMVGVDETAPDAGGAKDSAAATDAITPAGEPSGTSQRAVEAPAGDESAVPLDEAPAFVGGAADEVPADAAPATSASTPIPPPPAAGTEAAAATSDTPQVSTGVLPGATMGPQVGDMAAAIGGQQLPALPPTVPDPSVMSQTPPAPPADAIAGDSRGPSSSAPAGTTTPASIAGSAAVPPELTGPALGSPTETPSAAPLPPLEPGSAAIEPGAAAVAETESSSNNGRAALPRAAAPAQPPGQYLGNNDLLLRFDASNRDWVRLAPRTSLAWGDLLASLPTFRSYFVFTDANIHLAGGTIVELKTPDSARGDLPANFAIEIPAGQVIINSGLEGNSIEIVSGDFNRTVRLGPSSSLAIDVRRKLPAGTDPRIATEPRIIWHLTSGAVGWGAGLDVVDVRDSSTWTTVPGEPETPRAIDELPGWINHDEANPLERRARDAVAEALKPGGPVNLRLKELTDPTNKLGQRREVRALAAESGAFIDEFEPLVKALGDVEQRAEWKDQIQALRAALARDPAAAGAIREAFAAQHGEESADDLMEMLIGFDETAVGTTRDQINNGALRPLIRWLESDNLTYRVLAINDINEITGTSNLGGYRPEHSASQRGRIVERYYWQRLDNGELTPRK